MYFFVLASQDPYIMEERDPLKSNAILSSLWEIQTLQNHVIPNVATAARFINDPLPSVEWDISKVLDTTSSDVSKINCFTNKIIWFSKNSCSVALRTIKNPGFNITISSPK